MNTPTAALEGVQLLTELRPPHRAALREMLEATPAFSPEEIARALELVDRKLEDDDPGDDHFVLAAQGSRILGYVCYGPTPLAPGVYDVHGLATHPAARRRGIAQLLIATMEEHVRVSGGRLLRVETSSQAAYGGARQFYLAASYEEVAQLTDFYGPGNDLVTYCKHLGHRAPPISGGDLDFAALYDAAFGYRNYALERDFLSCCGQRFGRGEPLRVLEWACGPSRHLQAFADIGRDCVGVDLSAAMGVIARRRLGQRENVQIIAGDMRSTVVTPPVELAFTMLSSIHVLGNETDLLAHLRTCARSLVPGGLYVIEATHPRDLGDVVSETRWQQTQSGVTVEGHFSLGPKNGSESVPAVLELSRDFGERQHTERLQMRWRVLDLAGWRDAIARAADPECMLELVATLGDLDCDTPFEGPEAWRLVLVLRRPG